MKSLVFYTMDPLGGVLKDGQNNVPTFNTFDRLKDTCWPKVWNAKRSFWSTPQGPITMATEGPRCELQMFPCWPPNLVPSQEYPSPLCVIMTTACAFGLTWLQNANDITDRHGDQVKVPVEGVAEDPTAKHHRDLLQGAARLGT